MTIQHTTVHREYEIQVHVYCTRGLWPTSNSLGKNVMLCYVKQEHGVLYFKYFPVLCFVNPKIQVLSMKLGNPDSNTPMVTSCNNIQNR